MLSFVSKKRAAWLAVVSFAVSARLVSAQSAPAPVALGPEGTAAGQPALYPFLPTTKPTGGAVVIVPGAAFNGRNLDNEGVQLARWLNQRGIAGFVLRARTGGEADAATRDVSRAIQTVRARAASFQVSPKRVALLGFAGGAALAARAAYEHSADAKPDAADPAEKTSSRPDLLALVWGAHVPATLDAGAPPTFLVGSTHVADKMDATLELWNKLRATRVHVDAHLFAKADAGSGLGGDHPSLSTWPDMFHSWIRFQGLLTDEARVPVKGMVYLDGRTLPHGYVILTPVDFVGVGPVIGRVFNSTANQPLGLFSLPDSQGPIPGRYKVDVRQNMNRWISNSFTGALTGGGRGRGGPTPEQIHFGHHRVLSPSIDDQKSFTKARPSDRQELIIEIKPDPAANLDLKIEVFSK